MRAVPMTTRQLENTYDGRIPPGLRRMARDEDERRAVIKRRLLDAAAADDGATLSAEEVLSLTVMIQERLA